MGVRRARIGLLAAVLTGWMLIVVGLIGDFRLIVIVGASLLGIATTLVTKLVVELRTELAKAAGVDALDVVEARVALIERSAQRTRNDVSQVAAQSGLLSDEVVRLSGDAARAAAGVEQLLADARRLRPTLDASRPTLERLAPELAPCGRLSTRSLFGFRRQRGPNGSPHCRERTLSIRC